MKRIILLSILCILICNLVAQSDTLRLSLPQFSNPFYEPYTANYPGTSAVGRGYTGMAALGEIDMALINPAGVLPDSSKLFVELNIKTPIEAKGYPLYSEYTSPVPFGMVALSSRMGADFNAGFVYSVPKSVVLDDFAFFINQGGDIVQRFPTYYLHQLSGNISYHHNPLHLGLNLHGQIHYTDDPIFLRSYDRVRDYTYNFRVQPGIIYELGAAKLGFSMMPASRFNWYLKYADYDALQPLWLGGGISAKLNKFNLLADAEWEQTSAIHSSFRDRQTFKLGAEMQDRAYCFRLGYHYRSNVYAGLIKLETNTTATADTATINWVDVSPAVRINDNTQHSITIGLSYYHKLGSINLAALQCIVGDTPKTQINMSLGFYFYTFKPKGSVSMAKHMSHGMVATNE